MPTEVQNIALKKELLNITKVDDGFNIDATYWLLCKGKMHIDKVTKSKHIDFLDLADIRYTLDFEDSYKEKEIGLFELNLNMGKMESFEVERTFFSSLKGWSSKNGIIKLDKEVARFYLKDGKATFRAKNFILKDGIKLSSFEFIEDKLVLIFDYQKDILPFYQSYYPIVMDHSFSVYFAKDAISMHILKNLPYARRGYIFKNKTIANYYNKMPWYKKDKNYKPSINDLTKNEKLFLKDIEMIKRESLQLIKEPKRVKKFNSPDKFYEYITATKWLAQSNPLSKLPKKDREFLKNLEEKKSISDADFFRIINNYKGLK